MTKILANKPHGQMIFMTYERAAEHFKCAPSKVRKRIDNGLPLCDENGAWWLDILFDYEDGAK